MKSKFDHIIRLIPALKHDDFGEWIIDRENDGTPEHPIQFPYVRYSACVRELEQAIYELEEEFGLCKYHEILQRHGIDIKSREKTDVSKFDATATLALLYSVIRAERMCDGILFDFLKSGAILRWLERLQEIAEKEKR